MNINNLKTPTQLKEMFPSCEWPVQHIGYLKMMNLVKGVKVANGCLIDSESFENLLKFQEQNNLIRKK